MENGADMGLLRLLHLEHDRPLLERLKAVLSLKSANTQRSYLSALADFARHLGLTPEKAIYGANLEAAIGYLAELKKRSAPDGLPIAAATIRGRLDMLRAVWRELLALHIVAENPWDRAAKALPRSEEQKRPTQLINFEKVREMLNLPDISTPEGVRDRALLCVLFVAGLRREEAHALTLADVSISPLGVVTLRLRHTKGRKSATIGLPKWAGAAMLELIALRKEQKAKASDFIFTQFFSANNSKQLSITALYRIYKGYAKRVGFPSAAPHSARATAITKLLADGCDIFEVQQFSRHACVKTLQVYDKRQKLADKSSIPLLSY